MARRYRKKQKRSCCCCPVSDYEPDVNELFYPVLPPLSVRSGLDLFSSSGVRPEFIQYTNPSLYVMNELRVLRESDASGKVLGFSPDPNYPSDARSDPLALTPIYRGGQNSTLAYLDKSSFHGIDGTYNGGYYHTWDGVTRKTPFIVDTATQAERDALKQEVRDFLWPTVGGVTNYVMRGLKELYEATMPFSDETAPTVKEFEDWNLIVLNHFRNLLGLNFASYDQKLFLRCKWSDERKFTNLWDSYTGDLDSAYGPCIPGTNLHCGTTFTPATVDEQIPYWNENYILYPDGPPRSLVTFSTEAEAMGVFWNGNAFMAMSRVLKKLLDSTDAFGGHSGPFCFRPRLGYSLYGTAAGGIRSKWNGTIQQPPSGYIVA